METYDLFMLLVLAGAAMFGFWKGFAWQVASVASLVVSYIAALRLSPQLAPRFGDTEPWNKFVAMLVIYIVTSAIIWMAFRLISNVIDRVRLKEFDHQLGLMLGLAKGVLWCVAITFFAVTLLPEAQKETIIASRSGQYIVLLLDKTHTVVPPEIHDVIHPYIHRIEQRLDPNYQPDAEDLQQYWPGTTPQASWPAETNLPAQNPSGWPAVPRPFPGAYTAEQPGGSQY